MEIAYRTALSGTRDNAGAGTTISIKGLISVVAVTVLTSYLTVAMIDRLPRWLSKIDKVMMDEVQK